MKNRIVLTALCLFAAAANRLPAQNNIGEVFGGYAYAKMNPLVTLPKQNANGWMAGVAGYPTKWFGVGMEVAGQFGSIPVPSGVNAPPASFKEYSYLVGPQFRFVDHAKVQVNGKFLLGGVFGQSRLDSKTPPDAAQALANAGITNFDQTKFAMLFAAPVDYTITKAVGIRVEPGLYITDFSKTKQSNFRFSVGPVFRFGAR